MSIVQGKGQAQGPEALRRAFWPEARGARPGSAPRRAASGNPIGLYVQARASA